MPPTDNLYKFIALSGIIIYLYALNFGAKQLRENFELIKKYEYDSLECNNQLKKDSIKIEFLIFQAKKKFKQDFQNLTLNQLDSLPLNENLLTDFLEYKKLAEDVRLQEIIRKDISNRKKEPKIYDKASITIFLALLLLSSFLIPLGLLRWYLKIHIPEMKLFQEQTKHLPNEKMSFKKFFLKIKEDEILLISAFAIVLILVLAIFLGYITS